MPGGLLLLTLRDASHRLTLHDRTGAKVRDLPLPGPGAVETLHTQPDDPEVFLTFTSFLTR
ncbi:hypothetical protein CTI14_45450, partial [Methylobacterium radiotolerans]